MLKHVKIADSQEAEYRPHKDEGNYSSLLQCDGIFQPKFELLQDQGYSVCSKLFLLE